MEGDAAIAVRGVDRVLASAVAIVDELSARFLHPLEVRMLTLPRKGGGPA